MTDLVLLCTVSVIIFYLIVLGLIKILISQGAKSHAAATITKWIIPLSRLIMVCVLIILLTLENKVLLPIEKIAVFSFTTLGMLLPTIVYRVNKTIQDGDVGIDAVLTAVLTLICFFANTCEMQGAVALMAFQIGLPAASAASAISVVLLSHKKAKKSEEK